MFRYHFKMNFLKKIKLFFHYLFLKNKLHFFKRERKFINIGEAKEIGILFDGTETENRAIILQFSEKLKEENKHVELLGFVKNSKLAVDLDFPFYTKKNLNWFFVPSGEYISYFMHKPFDILISAYTIDNISLEYIAACSHAKFRVGKYSENKTHCHDFMINTEGNEELHDFMLQVSHYIKIIKQVG